MCCNGRCRCGILEYLISSRNKLSILGLLLAERLDMLRLKFRRKGKLSSSSFICIPWQQLRIVVRSSFRTSTRPFASILRWLFSIIYCLLQNLLFAGLKQRVSTFNFSAMFHYLLCFTSVTTFISFRVLQMWHTIHYPPQTNCIDVNFIVFTTLSQRDARQ